MSSCPTESWSHLGGPALDAPGLDLLGVLVGSEGTLAVATRVTLNLLRKPAAVKTLLAAFDSTEGAGNAVSGIIGAGIIPAAVEMMDRVTIEAAEAAVHPNFPRTEAILIVELDGAEADVTALFSRVEEVCTEAGAVEIQVARTDEQRARFWQGRKAAFAAMGRVSPSYYVQDGVIPRTRLPEVLGRIRGLSERSGLKIGNVFHAGDGNLHPLVCYDERIDGQADLAQEVASEILTYCLDAGGSITGEHGVGADKAEHLPKMFSEQRSRHDAARAVRVRPRVHLQSGQGLPHAAPLRRGAGSLSPASGRGGRAGGAGLSMAQRIDADGTGPRRLNAGPRHRARGARARRHGPRRRPPGT